MNKWELIHNYRRMVAQGNAEPINCPDDNGELLPVVSDDGEPALRCLSCRTVISPGLRIYEQMQRVVEQ